MESNPQRELFSVTKYTTKNGGKVPLHSSHLVNLLRELERKEFRNYVDLDQFCLVLFSPDSFGSVQFSLVIV